MGLTFFFLLQFCIMRKLVQCGKYFRSRAVPPYTSFTVINLQVRTKASSQEECVQEVEELLKTRYRSQSGIIYTTSIKDCEQLMQRLRDRKLRVGCYHANLEATLRSKVHAKWLSGEYQVGLCSCLFCLFLTYVVP
jgi:ATP-dependent DNA helicase Q1